ncbi:nicotinamidase/pyrazinamidase [Methylobacterium sp. RAS18]|nr:nicotinamidase/pyrazinamidase [Methylobacterium sp. RAS18]
MMLTNTDVLLIIDVQNDFLPGGALAVPDGDAVVAPINRLAACVPHVILTQDWHPPGHASFHGSHPGKAPFDTTDLSYGEQVLWPEHCVQGTHGAELAAGLNTERAELVIRKGYHPGIDSYSAFMEADRRTRTGLAGYLAERGLTRLFLAGLATDFCVLWTALDARAAGFEVFVIEDAVRGIDLDGSLARAWNEMERAAVGRIASAALG